MLIRKTIYVEDHGTITKNIDSQVSTLAYVGFWNYSTYCMCREACRDTQTSTRLARHLVRAPNSRIGGHDPLHSRNLVH
jgi:hypothetical protein